MNYKKSLILLFTAFFLLSGNANAIISDWHENESGGAKTRLLASFYQDKNGQQKLIAGLQFKISSGWKIYGNESDGIGFPPSFDFTGSENYATHQITWPQSEPAQEVIGDQILKYSTYHGEVILPVEITTTNAQATTLKLQTNYGLCKDICVPVFEEFSLTVPSEEDSEALALIQKFYPHKISTNDVKIDNKTSSKSSSSFMISSIIIALIGGAILNIMPCVLPVLSIKLLSIINHSGAKIAKIRLAFFATICGIISCFLFFALAAIALKTTGNSLGWGLQFQNPYFLIFLIVILVILSGNLLGIFEVNFDQFFANFLNKKITQKEAGHNIFVPNFLSGILAVLLATPCSAPFLGSAISFALTQNAAIIFAMFLAIGLGFASPYFLLLITPKLVYLLPKPGKWMFMVKKLMAVLLIITAVWLTYALYHNIGFIQALIVFLLATLLLFSLEIKLQFVKFFTIISLLIAIFYLPVHLQNQAKDVKEVTDNLWMEFDEEGLNYLVSQGNIVVVDVTADWCLTCKLNKARVLNSAEVIKKLKATNVFAMRADITKPDAKVIEFLRKHNRYAIPFNAVYGPKAKDGLLTSEFLNKKDFLELIEKAK